MPSAPVPSVGACMIERRRHHAHTAAAHGPLRARRAGGRRLSRMRHWKGHVPCSAVGAGECGGWHTTTARAVCARRRSQESAARRLSLHGPGWGSGGLAQAPETGLNSKLSNSDDTCGSTDLRLPTVDTTAMCTDPERLLSPGPGWYSTRVGIGVLGKSRISKLQPRELELGLRRFTGLFVCI